MSENVEANADAVATWNGDEGHIAYRLPAGFKHCSKLKPVVEAPSALERVRAVVTILAGPGGCP